MLTSRSYKVAGHVFRLEMEEGSPLWNVIPNYKPFECDAAEPLFVLTVEDLLECADKTLIYPGDSDDEGMSRLAIYRTEGGLWVDMAPSQKAPFCASLLLADGFAAGRLRIDDSGLGRFALDNSLMLMFAFSTAPYGTLEMHASVISCGGAGYMFLGRSGAGKSTHSRMWLENIPGSTLLNDDNPVVRVAPDGTVVVYGSPWSGKTPCYKNESVPVRAVVSITKAPHNALHRVSVPEAYAAIFPSCSGLKADKAMADAQHDSIAAFCMGVPAYELECLPDADAARTCYEGTGNAPLEIAEGSAIYEGMAACLSEGKDVMVKARGSSMLPFIRDNRDSVRLTRFDDVAVGDIVFVKLPSGRFVMHRVIRIEGEELTLMGDGNLKGTESCRKGDVKGTVVEIQDEKGRAKRMHDGRIWRRLMPLRRIILGIYRRLI